MADHDCGPVTASEIAEFLHRLARHRSSILGGDPTEHAALLAHKAELFSRIADKHAHTDPAHTDQARQAAERARAAVTRHAENTDTQDNTDVNDLTSPSSQRWGISLSDTAEFRRAPSSRHAVRNRSTTSTSTPPSSTPSPSSHRAKAIRSNA